VSQDLTTDSQLIEHGRRWRCVGGRVILWTHRGGVGRDFFQKTLGLFGGFDWKQHFLLQKFHPVATP